MPLTLHDLLGLALIVLLLFAATKVPHLARHIGDNFPDDNGPTGTVTALPGAEKQNAS